MRATYVVSILIVSICGPANLRAVDFAVAKGYSVGSTPSGITVGDFNGDGKLDIAVANAGSDSVSILLGNGDGTFQPAMNFSAGNSPSAIAVGDFNGDGKLDLALFQPGATGVAGSVGILLGNGDGTFQAPKTLTVSATASSMAVADFNLDKKSDLAVGDPEGLNIFIGNGDGTFKAASQMALSSRLNGIVTADFNGDSKPDAALLTDSGIQILLGKGDGTFSQAVLLPVLGSPESGVAADLNRDGKVDLVVNTKHLLYCCGLLPYITTRVAVLLGNGDGSFQSEQIVAIETHIASLRSGPRIDYPLVGDFNGDGKLDLAYLLVGGPGISLNFLLGKGDGSFSSPVTTVALPGNVKPITKDLNNDKLDDLIFVDTTNNDIDIQLNTSPTSGADLGILSPRASPTPAGVGANETLTADVVNLGPQDATGVSFTDTLPNGVSFISAAATPGSCVQSNGVVSCSIGALASAFDSKVSIVVTPTAVGTITNSMGVTANEHDPVPANNSATQTVQVIPAVTLSVTEAGKGSGTVTSSPAAINCASTCSANFSQGTSVNLTATAATGSVFSGWGGACTGSDPHGCNLTMNSAQSVTATFSSAGDFTLVAATPTFTMQTSAQVTDTLTLTAQNGLSGQVSLSCTVTGPTPLATCNVSPSSVTLGSSPSSSTLTITAPNNLVAFVVPFEETRRIAAYPGVLPVFGLLLSAIGLLLRRFEKPRLLWRSCLCASIAAMFVALAGCGGGGTTPPLQPENYVVTVSAISTSASLQHSTTIAVTVH